MQLQQPRACVCACVFVPSRLCVRGRCLFFEAAPCSSGQSPTNKHTDHNGPNATCCLATAAASAAVSAAAQADGPGVSYQRLLCLLQIAAEEQSNLKPTLNSLGLQALALSPDAAEGLLGAPSRGPPSLLLGLAALQSIKRESVLAASRVQAGPFKKTVIRAPARRRHSWLASTLAGPQAGGRPAFRTGVVLWAKKTPTGSSINEGQLLCNCAASSRERPSWGASHLENYCLGETASACCMHACMRMHALKPSCSWPWRTRWRRRRCAGLRQPKRRGVGRSLRGRGRWPSTHLHAGTHTRESTHTHACLEPCMHACSRACMQSSRHNNPRQLASAPREPLLRKHPKLAPLLAL